MGDKSRISDLGQNRNGIRYINMIYNINYNIICLKKIKIIKKHISIFYKKYIINLVLASLFVIVGIS